MENSNITPGAIVWLKSGGGPKMTTKSQSDDGEWLCTWFLDYEVKEHYFAAEQLTTVDPHTPVQLPPMNKHRRNSW